MTRLCALIVLLTPVACSASTADHSVCYVFGWNVLIVCDPQKEKH